MAKASGELKRQYRGKWKSDEGKRETSLEDSLQQKGVRNRISGGARFCHSSCDEVKNEMGVGSRPGEGIKKKKALTWVGKSRVVKRRWP